MSGQCDQILYTFATLAKNRSLWLFVDGLFSFWINFEPILAISFYYFTEIKTVEIKTNRMQTEQCLDKQKSKEGHAIDVYC